MLQHTKKGFSLVELILVVAILGVVGVAIMTIFQFTTRSYSASDSALAAAIRSPHGDGSGQKRSSASLKRSSFGMSIPTEVDTPNR
jgi:prepilin-type N-terminal cleavage/methylation domain-containing protein